MERIEKHSGIHLVQGLKLQKPTPFKEILSAGVGIAIYFLSCLYGWGQMSYTPTAIRFEGLKRTKTQIVMRERTFNVGQAILLSDTAQIFHRMELNVFNTKLFNFARYSIDSVKGDSAGHTYGQVVVRVSERWYTFPSPIVELADRNFNEWWYDRNRDLRRVNLGIRFVQHNVRGRNEDLSVTVQDGFTRRYEIGYVFPYLDKAQTMGLRLAGAYANNRDVAVRTLGNRLVYNRDERGFGRERWNGSMELTQRKSIYEYQYLAAGYNFNRISDSTLFWNSNYFGESRQSQRFIEVRYTWVSDHRNLRNFSTKGYYLAGFAGQSGLLPTDDVNITMVRLSGAKYHQLAKRWFWASKADVEYSTPSKQPYYGSRALGYESRYPRGYERYVIEGHFNTYSRNTLRFKTFSQVLHLKWIPIRQFQFMPVDIYLTGYGDAGYVDNPNVLPGNERLTNELLIGYGFGINLVTFYDVVFRTEFSMTRQGDRGLFFSFLTDI